MWKKYSLQYFWLILGLFLQVQAQTTTQVAQSDSIYSKVDVPPRFPGGWKALGKYVDGKNHYYPKQARDRKIEGKVVIQFIIHQDGTPSDFKVIQGLGFGCDEAALEAFQKMPKWKPGLVNGKAVSCRTQMAYLYKLGFDMSRSWLDLLLFSECISS